MSNERLPKITELKNYLEYRFTLHQHPYVQELIQRLIDDGVEGLQDADTANPALYESFFKAMYDPQVINANDPLVVKYPVKDLDFDPNGAYAIYNWELFYHVPILMAIHLSKNQH